MDIGGRDKGVNPGFGCMLNRLPGAIDTDHIEAIYQQGFLVVRLPKAKPRQVPVVSTEDSDG